MKKSISILFVSIYTFTAFQISEYLKIPVLMRHFIEHQQENPKLSLSDFLSNHYTQIDDFDGDNDKDNQLPFKSHHSGCSCSSIVTLYVAIQSFNFSSKTLSIEYKKPTFGYTFIFISNFHSTIWQPPKIC